MDHKLNCVCGEKLSTDEFMCSSCILIYIEEPAGPSTIQPSIWQQPSQDSTQGALFQNNPPQYVGSEACPGYPVEPQQWTPNQIFPQNPLASAQPAQLHHGSLTTHHATHNLMPAVDPAISDSESTASHDPYFSAQQQLGLIESTIETPQYSSVAPQSIARDAYLRFTPNHHPSEVILDQEVQRNDTANEFPDPTNNHGMMSWGPSRPNDHQQQENGVQFPPSNQPPGSSSAAQNFIPLNQALGATPSTNDESDATTFTLERDDFDDLYGIKCPLCEAIYTTKLSDVHNSHMAFHTDYKICGVRCCYTYFKKDSRGEEARNAHDSEVHSHVSIKCRYRSCVVFGSIQLFRNHVCKRKT